MSIDRDNAPKSLVELLEDKPKSLSEYRDILIRRRWLFLLPAVAISIGTILMAMSLPDNFRSEATILIEDHDMPKDIVGSTVTNYAARQVELISRRLLTASNIQPITEKFEIYGPVEPDNPVPATVLASWFRQDMELGLVASDELDSKRRSGDPVIAIELAFNSGDPELSRQVTEELVSLFLNENRRASASRTTEVSELLKAAIDEAGKILVSREAELASFKERHEGALPELQELNLDVINRAEQQLSDVTLRIQQLQQRRIQLTAELANISPSAPVKLPSGETIMSDRERLRVLLIDYSRKIVIYEQGHPDLVRLEREIAALRKSTGESGGQDFLQEQLRQEREKLSALRDRYSDNHPDIIRSEAAIAKMQKELASSSPSNVQLNQAADNPAYVFLNTQLQSSNLEIQGLIQKRLELQAKIDKHELLIKQAPQVEMQYEGLLRSYEDAKAKYVDLQGKLRAAEIGGGLDQNITGRRFTLIEPPVLPLGPNSPDRPVIVLIGCLLAAAVGVGFVIIAELVDNSIRGVEKLTDIFGAPPLAVIPYLDNSADIAQARSNRMLLIGVTFAVGAFCLLYVRYVIPQL